jgi:hypothetical protein
MRREIQLLNVVLLLFLFSCDTSTDPPAEKKFEIMYGGSGYDVARSIQETNEGGYIIAGSSFPVSTDIWGNTTSGIDDCYIVKIDSAGNVEWQKMIGGSDHDQAYSIQETSDGGYIVAGFSESTDIIGLTNQGLCDYYIIKLDSAGNIIWQKMYGGADLDNAISIKETKDGGYVVLGHSEPMTVVGGNNNNDCYSILIKLDGNGNIIWQKIFGESFQFKAASFQQTSDGGYIVAGNKDIYGEYPYAYVIKLDSDVNVEWHRTYGGSEGAILASIQLTNDGGYIVAGTSSSPEINGNTDIPGTKCYLLKLDNYGYVMWERVYPDGLGARSSYLNSASQTGDGGYIAAGYNDDGNFESAGWRVAAKVVNFDIDGNIRWERYFTGNAKKSSIISGGVTSTDVFNSILETKDGRFIAAGSSNAIDYEGVTNHGTKDFFVVKFESDGTISIIE